MQIKLTHWDPKIFQTCMAQDYLNEKGFEQRHNGRKNLL